MNRGFVRAILVLVFAGSGSLVWGQANQVLNGEFDDDLNSWGRYGAAGYTVEVVSGARLSGANAAMFNVTDASVASIGLSQGGLKFERGKKYPIGLMAKADKEREIVILIQLYKPEGPNWIDIVFQRFALTTEPQTFVYEYTHNDDSLADHPAWVATMYVMLKGQWWSMAGADVVSKVWVDRVHVGEQPALVDSSIRYATEPRPADGAVDVPRDAALSWAPGDFSVARDVYFGPAFADVNAASRDNPLGVLAGKGQADTAYDPAGLFEYGQTYYWRVDEVNGAPDNTIFKGKTWSFTAEPYAYPITGVAAAASSEQVISPAIRTIDRSGLNQDDQHDIDMNQMWMSNAGLPAWIQYTFDKEYQLHELWVWNANSGLEGLMGFGAKDVVVEHSLDGQTWTRVENVPVFAQGTGMATYTANTKIDLGKVTAKHVKLTVNTAWGASGIASLSEVRFFYVPLKAFAPSPAVGATDVSVASGLDWRPGRDVTSHKVYLGTDQQAVADGLVAAVAVNDHGYTPASLAFGTTYYWKVDEAGDAGTVAGDVWSFTTAPYAAVEDFESYTDDEGSRIYQFWIDGYADKSSGSTVGHLDAPFAEQTIVHGGKQSMPLAYDNTAAPFYSEAKLTFDSPQDWTSRGIKTLALYFAGTPGNGGKLYVKIDGTKIAYDGDQADLARNRWQAWNIDLSQAGNVAAVRSLTIGVEGSGTTGMLYIDDIRLSPQAGAFLTPVEPDVTNLVARYAFENDLKDTSGKGRNGTGYGGQSYLPGADGQALRLDGIDDYVVVGSVGISGAAPRTISGWVKPDTMTITDWTNLFGFTSTPDSGAALSFDMNKMGGANQYCIHVYGWERAIVAIDLEWHHLAATYDGTTVSWYGDGQLVGQEAWVLNTQDNVQMGKRGHAAGGNFPGSLDEVRIYNKALSEEEIAWLAGRRLPVHKPL